MAGETLCTGSIAIASWLYSLSTVIKILPMFAGIIGVSGEGQPALSAPLQVNFVGCWHGSVRSSITTLLSEQEIKNLEVEPVFGHQFLSFATDCNFLEKGYEVEPTN